MPHSAWSDKRERQYEHIKASELKEGRSEKRAEEIAARTVNKERARIGESRASRPTSTEDVSSGQRGGVRSRRGPGGRTYTQLYEEAKMKNIKGRSSMNKRALEKAVDKK
jgi:plasmid stabilization system protein ParE